MAVRAQQRVEGGGARALAALAAAAPELAAADTLEESLQALARATAAAAGATLVVIRARDEAGLLRPVAVAADSAALAAEVEGSRVSAAELGADELTHEDALPPTVRRLAERAGAASVLVVPLLVAGTVSGSLELLRSGTPLGEDDRLLARLAAAQATLALRAFGAVGGLDGRLRADALEFAGEALAAGSDGARVADEIVRLAARATGAQPAVLWRLDEAGPALLASSGGLPLAGAERAVARALAARPPVTIEPSADGADGASVLATLRLGQPPLGALQLVFAPSTRPSEEGLAALATFAVRAAQALRSGERGRELEVELDRTRALLAVVGQAIARLSLAHTLETAVERVAELLSIERVALYLSVEGRLLAAAGRELAGPHLPVAERLLELALGPLRARGIVVVEDASLDPRLEGLDEEVDASGIEAALALPMLVRDEVVGLLALFPPRGRVPTEAQQALLAALAGQLAVAVQNASLHEHAKSLGSELEHALDAEKQGARRLGALYEISRSFAQSLSLDTTVDALARTVVELLEVDAAVIRIPDARGDALLAQAVHVADERLLAPLETIVGRPQPVARALMRRFLQRPDPILVTPETVEMLGAPHELLIPFLAKGSSAAVIPIATQAEVLATLTLVSLDPARSIDGDTLESAVSIARQAALALDNARLYQQQKAFSDTMQRSLLPRAMPEVPGLELGDVYESSARVDVGGDVYDYMELPDGRLAVVLGDVTGHGIEAAADMAMAKFTFRSLAREHPEPGDFLAHANDVVGGEIALGKFITMSYLVFDPARNEVACACAGHPPPRLVGADGSVSGLEATGLALGIDTDQTYAELRTPFPPGSTVVLYTDGVIEARSERDLYGQDRLDELLAARHELPAKELASAILADCRAFAGGELPDDVAIVVIRRTG